MKDPDRTLRGEQLIEELMVDSVGFTEQGKAYELLQEYFGGMSLESMLPLLCNSDRLVRRAGIWMASELARDACSLIHDVIPLTTDNDQYIRYHAFESVMLCSVGPNVAEFVHVVKGLEDKDDKIRAHVMFLISNANSLQIETVCQSYERLGRSGPHHKTGLTLLSMTSLEPGKVLTMINDNEPLIRRYGAVAARRLVRLCPDLIEGAILTSDTDIRKYLQKILSLARN